MGCCDGSPRADGSPPDGSLKRAAAARLRICQACPSGRELDGVCQAAGAPIDVLTASAHDCPDGWFIEETCGRSLPEMKRALARCDDCKNQRFAAGNLAEKSCVEIRGDLVHFHRELSAGSCPIGRWAANPRAGDPLIHAGDLTGSKPPPTSLIERRLSLCSICEHSVAPGLHVRLAAWIMRLPFLRSWRPDSLSMCARCKCWIELKVRAKWSRCPIGKW